MSRNATDQRLGVPHDQPTIFVVDDDPAVSRAIAGVARLLGAPVQAYQSPVEFLENYELGRPGCLVLDLKMPEMSGLELQRRLREMGSRLPIIIVSGHADVRIAVQAMTHGARTILEKPFHLDELLSEIRKAIEWDRVERQAHAANQLARQRVASLTAKEREVLEMLVAGKTNKQMAAALGLSLRAIEDRRGRLMRKLEVRSLPELLVLVRDGL